MSLGKFSVKNPVLINILMVLLFVLGYFSLVRLPKQQFTEVPFYWANIIIPYPGVAAGDIESSITVKIENELSGLDKLEKIQSTVSEGLTTIRVEFENGISSNEFDKLLNDVQSRVNKVSLPDGALKPVVDDFSSADFLPVVEVIVSGDAEYSQLLERAERLNDRLLAINDVAKIDLIGNQDTAIFVKIDRNKMEAAGLSLVKIIAGINSQNINIPGGKVETRSREYLVRTIGEIGSVRDLSRLVIKQNKEAGNALLRLGELAAIEQGYSKDSTLSRFNGKESITLRIAKKPDGNSLRLVQQLKQELGQFSLGLPPGIETGIFNDSTIQIKDSINVLVNNAVFGLILLVLILMLFIGIRNALLTALAIPTTFALTVIVLEIMGESFNTSTLFGLVLVLGLIVDHSIVIIENIYRLRQEGTAMELAAIKGTDQVVTPVIAATATTIAAFLPLMIIPGTIGLFLRVIPLTVSIALIASTAEAMVFLPTHFVEWGSKKEYSQNKDSKPDIFSLPRKYFKKMLERIYPRKGLVLIVSLAVIILTFFLIRFLKQDLFAAEDFTYFYIDVEMPLGTPRSKTDKIIYKFEEKLMPLLGKGEIVAVNSSIGFQAGAGGNNAKSNLAQILVDVAETKDGRKRPLTLIMQDVQNLCQGISGFERVEYRKVRNGPPVDPPVSFRLQGDDYRDLEIVSEEIQEQLNQYDEIFNIKDNLEPGTPDVQIRVNKDRAYSLGLNPLEIGNFIRTSFDGLKISTLFQNNKEIEIIVKYDMPDNFSLWQLDQMKIPTADGRLIPFSSVCTLTTGNVLDSVKRIDGKREVTISAETYSKDNIRKINQSIVKYFADNIKQRFPGIVLKVGGEFSQFNDLLIQILRIFLIGLFLIYLILGTQFNSYSQPFLILVSIPAAFVGVIIFLLISGTSFSTTVLYAGVALAGIAVNDAIVLISFINTLVKSGSTVSEAVILAATTRLRPIVLTSLTTIAGLLPTALGIGGKSIIWGPMASTIIFGLLFSTVTALIVVPCLYGFFYDRQKKA